MRIPTILWPVLSLGLLLCTGTELRAAPQVVVQEPMPFPPFGPGDSMLPGDHLPVLAKKVDVVYPAELASQGIGDRVFVAFVVDDRGSVRKPRVAFGERSECEAAAVDAVRQWTFTPGQHMGKPVHTQMMVEIRFVPTAASPQEG